MKNDSTLRKMKFLATKLSALQLEVKVSREIFQAASADVQTMFDKKYFPEVPVVNEDLEEEKEKPIKEYSEDEREQPSGQEEQKRKSDKQEPLEDQTSAKKNTSPEVKKMFKKIASQCHPDKLGELEDGFEKKKKLDLYARARQALEGDDVVLMADVAIELGVEVPEITEHQLKKTEKKIIAIKKELSDIESTMVWHWFFTEDEQQKTKILEKLFDLMYAANYRS